MTQTPTAPTAPTTQSESVLLRKMKVNVIKIEKVLKNNLKNQLTNKKNDDKNTKKLRFTLQESNVEKEKPKIFKSLRENLAIKTGIIDSISNFAVWTFLGFVFTRTEKFLPKLTGLIKVLSGVANIFGWMTKNIVDFFAGFIKFGYDIKDKITGESDKIKKLPVEKDLDKFSSVFDDTLNKTLGIVEGIAKTKPPKVDDTPVKAAKSGGIINSTRGNVPVNRPITREIAANKKKNQRIPLIKQKINESAIGSDVGGENKVRQFYKNPKTKNSLKNRGPVDSISTISKTLRQTNSLFSDMASVGSDIAIGRKPSRNVYINTAKDVITLAELINENYDERIKTNILGMAYGGVVDSKVKNVSNKGNVIDLVATIIQRNIDNRVNKALAEIRMNVVRENNEIERKKRESEYVGPVGVIGPDGQFYGPGGAQTPDAGYSDEYGNVSKIEMGGLSQNEIRDLGKIIQAEAGGEDDLGKAAVMNVILNRYRLIKSGKARPADFGVTGKKAKDVTITDIIIARNGKEFQPVRDGSFYRISINQGQSALEKAIRAGGNDPEKLMANLKKTGKKEKDAEYVARSVGFYNPSITASKDIPFSTPTIKHGRHGFQQSPFIKVTGKIGKMDAKIEQALSKDVDVNQQRSQQDRATGKFARTEWRYDTDGQQTGIDIELFGKRGMIPKTFNPNSKEGPYGNRGVEISFPFELIYYEKVPKGFSTAGRSTSGIDGTTQRVYKGTGISGHGHYGSYFYRDPKTNKMYEIYMGHGNKPFKKFKDGERISPGTVVGWQGASGSSDDMAPTARGVYDHLSLHVNGQHGVMDAQKILLMITNTLIKGEGAKLTELRRKQKPKEPDNKIKTEAERKKEELEKKAKNRKFSWQKPVLVDPNRDELIKRIKNLNTIGENNSFEMIKKGKKVKFKRVSSKEVEMTNDKGEKLIVDIKRLEYSYKNNISYADTDPKKIPSAPKLPPPSAVRSLKSPAISRTSARKPTSKAPTTKPKTKVAPKPKRAWWDPRGWFGKKRGGFIGNVPNSVPSGYASYESNYGNYIFAIQPMIITQTVPVETPVAMPFPIATNVNSSLPHRA